MTVAVGLGGALPEMLDVGERVGLSELVWAVLVLGGSVTVGLAKVLGEHTGVKGSRERLPFFDEGRKRAMGEAGVPGVGVPPALVEPTVGNGATEEDREEELEKKLLVHPAMGGAMSQPVSQKQGVGVQLQVEFGVAVKRAIAGEGTLGVSLGYTGDPAGKGHRQMVLADMFVPN